MAPLGDFFRGLTGGARAAPAGHPFERMCAELRWQIEGRPSAEEYEVGFGGGRFGRRSVLVYWGKSSATFKLRSAAVVHESRLPRGVGCALLARNDEMLTVAWRMHREGDRRWGFTAAFVTLWGGMTAPILRVICTKLCDEVEFVDDKLFSLGLI